MNPVRQGDGVGLSAAGFSEVREGDGTVLWSQGGAIPDRVVSRDPDNDSFADAGRFGVKFTANESWPSIQGEISANTASATRAYLTETDGTIIMDIDISGLSAGGVFSFNNISLASGTYYMMLDAEGSSYTIGRDNGPSFPYNSSDGLLSIDAGVFDGGGSETPNSAYLIRRLGNINQ